MAPLPYPIFGQYSLVGYPNSSALWLAAATVYVDQYALVAYMPIQTYIIECH